MALETLCLTYLAWKNYMKGMKLFSNYKLKGMPHLRIRDTEDIINMREGFAALDELWTWVDARQSGKKKNKFITLVLAKSRKRGLDIAYTTQRFYNIDIRVRQVTDLIVIPQMSSSGNFCTVRVYENPMTAEPVKVMKFYARAIYPLYDTNEEVDEFDFDEMDDDKKEKVKRVLNSSKEQQNKRVLREKDI